MKRVIIILIALIGFGISAQAQKKVKTIYVTPDNAKIILGGIEVGTGSYDLTMGKQDFVVLRLTAPGFIDKTVRINKADKSTTYNFRMEEDDSYNASEVSSDLANKAMNVTVRKKIAPDEVWKRINYYTSEAFPDLQINDKSSGWLRSAWAIQKFRYVTIRTRIEIKEVPGLDELTYKVTLQSEWGDNNCGLDDQCFKQWDRVLKRYKKAVEDLLNSLN
jgi:hypothetical protein